MTKRIKKDSSSAPDEVRPIDTVLFQWKGETLYKHMTAGGKNPIALQAFNKIKELQEGEDKLRQLYQGLYMKKSRDGKEVIENGLRYNTATKLAILWVSCGKSIGQLNWAMQWN